MFLNINIGNIYNNKDRRYGGALTRHVSISSECCLLVLRKLWVSQYGIANKQLLAFQLALSNPKKQGVFSVPLPAADLKRQ
jgi:hypothetical protein